MGKLALISSEYGVLHVFNVEGDEAEELAHGVYRWIVEDLYDNEDARCAENFGQGLIGHEQEEHEASWDSEGESSS